MLERIRIVLIGTSHPGNIGATARAMHNMGLADLALVAPRSESRSAEAISRASGADKILHHAPVYDDLESAVADCRLVVGASARSRTLPWPMITPRALGERLPAELADAEARVALVFGREDTGLTNAELQRCHAHVHIPTNPDYSSLNLAAAVQVLAYECRLAWLDHQPAHSAPEASTEPATQRDAEADQVAASAEHEAVFGITWDHPPASHADLERYFAHLERTLITLKFHDPDKPRQLMARLRRLYLRARPDQMEVNILRGILSATEKHTARNDQA
ncbi:MULTISPECIES: RNA methyltransferase [Halomonadaceae]|uniref:RNA methyltransferase n=1 Tax=Halomonadaceae TaxID=28256 RepID=UPI001581B310|nr:MULTISPECIES: RNA methyltransferase [Halomonas]MDI4638582.1 RNA methyltransferase [Halomonas sp. BMC7]NUJ59568.1 RNA methyltransferase [Halomonas taeanensis]|tara:strand:+ start:4023 stop:4856 length:834 start_codon:yes stop_codon:yes gene_type:complete